MELTNTNAFFNKSKVSFEPLQGNPKSVLADTLSSLHYSAIDLVTEREFTIVSTQVIKAPPRAAVTILPTVVTATRSPTFGWTQIVVITSVTSTSVFTLSSVDGMSVGTTLTISGEDVDVISINGLEVTTGPLSVLPLVDTLVSYLGIFSLPNEVQFSFTVASTDFGADLFLMVNLLDPFNHSQSVLIPLPK